MCELRLHLYVVLILAFLRKLSIPALPSDATSEGKDTPPSSPDTTRRPKRQPSWWSLKAKTSRTSLASTSEPPLPKERKGSVATSIGSEEDFAPASMMSSIVLEDPIKEEPQAEPDLWLTELSEVNTDLTADPLIFEKSIEGIKEAFREYLPKNFSETSLVGKDSGSYRIYFDRILESGNYTQYELCRLVETNENFVSDLATLMFLENKLLGRIRTRDQRSYGLYTLSEGKKLDSLGPSWRNSTAALVKEKKSNVPGPTWGDGTESILVADMKSFIPNFDFYFPTRAESKSRYDTVSKAFSDKRKTETAE